MKQFVFGYGSLIERASRVRTTPEATEVHPIVIHGYQRGWYAHVNVPGLTTTFLGCRRSDGPESVNGIMYEVTAAQLARIDVREAGYLRAEISPEAIDVLSDVDLSEAIVYVYLSDIPAGQDLSPFFPSPEAPIVQSYVDICLNGCLEIEELFPAARDYGFAANFIRSTVGWNGYWVNDRIYPRRPFIHCPNAYRIDQLLQDHLPDPSLFNLIYFE
ncbi:gamma-glutamyl AIG2-like cyclotransferase [Neolewinella xylanilytica]|uniref:Gamma-glutamyl AIG2-like cyclotransferase n=1 Tax=Neolewinella xylanilytica TaxID=1514080 RepID=A0A2S6I2N9_9BACT|nr:gamma-glutamylcyclotransferase family protein [Neolewinella xylanilytica]PPK85423.1 gamma-glutamyl AIG2-like cyclotransferase [Neolewinella xylanilytica]